MKSKTLLETLRSRERCKTLSVGGRQGPRISYSATSGFINEASILAEGESAAKLREERKTELIWVFFHPDGASFGYNYGVSKIYILLFMPMTADMMDYSSS